MSRRMDRPQVGDEWDGGESAAEEVAREAFEFDRDRLEQEAMRRGAGDPWTALEWLFTAWRGTDLSSTASDYEDTVRDAVADRLRQTLPEAAREAFDAGVDHEEFQRFTRAVIMRHAVPPMSTNQRDAA